MNTTIIFSVALFIILPKIGFIDLSILPLLLLLSLVLTKRRIVNSFPLAGLIFLLTLILICLVTFSSSLINEGAFFQEFILKPVRVIIVTALSLFVVMNLSPKDEPFESALKGLMIASLLNSLVIFMQYFNAVTGYGDPLIFSNPNFGNIDTPFRKPGITAGYPIAGMLSLFGTLIAFWFFFVREKGIKYLGVCIVCFLTLFLTARTTMLIFLVYGLPLLFISYKNNTKKFFAVVTCIMLVVIYVVSLYATSDFVKGTVEVMFANFFNYFDSGTVLDYSSRDLVENHYEIPSAVKDLIIGNSLPPRESPVNSDVSFVRIWWSNGILGLALYVLNFLSLYFCFVQNTFRSSFWSIGSFMFLAVFVASFKGPFLLSRTSFDALIIVAVFSLSLKGKLSHEK